MLLYPGVKPQTCISNTGSACNTYVLAFKPHDCLTATQLRNRVRVLKAKALAAAARAKAQAAAIAAANAWHQGYFQQNENVYWKWVNGESCKDYAQNGCWHVEVITRNGCPSYVAVNANEYAGGAIINSLLDNQGYGIPPKTPRVFELDADQSGVTAGNVSIDCQ